MNARLKKFLKISLLLLGVLTLIVIICGYWLLNSIDLSDGPFTGAVRSECNLKNPRSRLLISPNIYLESFDPSGKENAPTVRLTDHGKIKWCIYAHGLDNTNVYQIKFTTIKNDGYSGIIVSGPVHWTYGHEYTKWKLDNDRNLIEYRYSW